MQEYIVYFSFFDSRSWTKRSAVRRRRFDWRFPNKRGAFMSEKRWDNRGCILHVEKSQRSFSKYIDLNGAFKFVYSWRLDSYDRMPAGKAKDLSLREKECQIRQDQFNKAIPNGGNLTVLELVEKYCLRRSTFGITQRPIITLF